MTANYGNIIHGYTGVPSGNSSFLLSRTLTGIPTRPHEGVDLAATAGTPVYAAANGEVVQSWTSQSLGNAVVVRTMFNGAPVFTVYGHLQNPSALLQGDTVIAGTTQIGAVGNTGTKPDGSSYDYHLHYEERVGNPNNLSNWKSGALPVDPSQNYFGFTQGTPSPSGLTQTSGTAILSIPGTPAPLPTDPGLAYVEITGDYTGRLYENGVVYYKNTQTGVEFWSVPTSTGGVVETTQAADGACASVEYTAAGTLDASVQNTIQFARQQSFTLSSMSGMTAGLQAASNAGLQTLQDILNNDPLATINPTAGGQGIEVVSGGNTYTLTGGQLIQNVTDASGNVTGVNFLAGQLAGQTLTFSADGGFVFTDAQAAGLANSGAFRSNFTSTGTPILDTSGVYAPENYNGIIHTTLTETGTGNVIADITFQSQWSSGQRLGSITTVYKDNVIAQTVDTKINGNTVNVTYTYDSTGEPIPHVNSINGKAPTDQNQKGSASHFILNNHATSPTH